MAALLATGWGTTERAHAQACSEIAHVLASDGAESDYFGSSVSISADTAIVGARGDDSPAGQDSGSVYVFTRSGLPGEGVWTQQQKLTASDAAAFDHFGVQVSISSDTAIVGANGSAYVFTRSAGVWTLQQKLTASDGAVGDLFGHSVSISGDTAFVGAHADDTPAGQDSGSAHVFTRSAGVWTLQQKLTASDATANDLFGNSVSISGDTAIVGARDNNIGVPGLYNGSAYVFTRSGPPGQEVWTQQQKLTASDAAGDDHFGWSVAISGDTAISGAPWDNTAAGNATGSAYVFTRSPPDQGVWSQQQKLTASDGAAGDKFGYSVSISGDTAIVGALLGNTAARIDSGSAYVFTHSAGVWTQQQKLIASDGAAYDVFGVSVSISGETAIVGAEGDDTAVPGLYNGSAYVFECPACLADIAPLPTGNGIVDVSDLAAVIPSWGPCPAPCPADINADGTVNVDDLLAVINAWGPCP